MAASEVAAEIGLRQPYPGLRAFEPDEALKFHGRETHTAELLRRLSENRFIAVVGNSGSGKSSLVRAGLLPALYRGRLIGATSQWRICIMRPGDSPMKSLAQSLADQKVFSSDKDEVLEEVQRSSLGLVRAVRSANLAPGESLLLVVDQFEELFRFARKEKDGGAEARLFVASLLEAADLSSAPVYVVITMRSDFLGYCSRFPGLPEALNRSQYLIPRMTREQLRDAIEKPLRLVDARMSARLVERLLNELGDDTGQLPVLQHALNRTFHEFEKKRAGAGSDTAEIGVDDFAAAGELKGALNAHAESLLDSQYPRETERVFRCLTTVEGGRNVRRPTRLDRLFAIAGAGDEASKQKVTDVIERYGHPDHAMLVWSGKKLASDSVVDISHESLIEHWDRLKAWVTTEAEAATLYQNAAQDAGRHSLGTAAHWRGQRLSQALGFIEKGPWNEAWAEQQPECGTRFPAVKEFIENEAAAQRAEEQEKEARHARDLEAERKGKEDAEARAAAETLARVAEGQARIFAVKSVNAERQAREEAEVREAAERRAKEAAENLAEAERRTKEAAEALAENALARAAAEKQAKEDAEARANAEALAHAAELDAREAAELGAEAERKRREEAEIRAAAERRAKEAAESLVRAERRTKRWVVISLVLAVALLTVGGVAAFINYRWLDAQKKLNAAGDLVPALRQQITATDDTLRQNASQQLELRRKIDQATDPAEKTRLQATLKELQDQETKIRKQRKSAEAKLRTESSNTTRVNTVDGLTYVFIPSGSFLMGCSPGDNECDTDEKPPHAEQIASGFWLGQTEVTQAAWQKVKGDNRSQFKSDQLPVDSVDWNQAADYCNKIGGRLPTEKEWEYAARAGTTGPRYGAIDAVAWYSNNSGGTTHPVGLKQANAFGLFDMLGNVFEWTADNYDTGRKTLRGGSWGDYTWYVRASYRDGNVPTLRFGSIGFRCAGEFR